MDALTFARLPGPSVWPDPPALYSFSSLQAMEQCPRRWQLRNAQYADLDRLPEPPGEAIEQGLLVHEALGRLLRLLSLHGLPAPGEEAFEQARTRADIAGFVQRRVEEIHARIAQHPRAATVRWRLSAQEIINAVFHQFQRTYPALRAKGKPIHPAPTASSTSDAPLKTRLALRGLLSEERVQHPWLPLHGFIDLVHEEKQGSLLIDFKTGTHQEEHRAQLVFYALLWWRATGEIPQALALRYGGEELRWSVTEAELTALEASLEQRLSTLRRKLAQAPAEPSLGEHCRRCPGRQFCPEYWTQGPGALGPLVAPVTRPQRLDAELQIEDISPGAIVGTSTAGHSLTVVHEEDARLICLQKGQIVRLLSLEQRPGETALLLRATSEVFLPPGENSKALSERGGD